MKQITTKENTRLAHMFKAAIPERERAGFLLSYTNWRTACIDQLNSYEADDLQERLAKVVKLANAAQIQKLQCLYRELKLTEQKKELLLAFSEGRTDSTAGLTFDEARDLIQELAQHEPRERIRKAVFSFAYQAGIIYGETETDKKINRAKLNMFLRDRGAVKKDIEKQTLDELKLTMAQMAGIVRGNERTVNNKAAKAATAELLKELNFKTK